MTSLRARSLAALILASTLTAGFGSSAVWAAGPGFGDVSDAMVYDTNGPVGAVLSSLSGTDDGSTTIAAAFPINFFGTRYEGLCVSTNGTITPVATTTDSCIARYDQNVENLAINTQSSLIAALALDLDPSERLWVPGSNVASVEIAAGSATITTASPHAFSAGDTFYSWFSETDPAFARTTSGTVTSVLSPTSFTFPTATSDQPLRAVAGATVSIGPYNNLRDDTDLDGLADDGFGAVKQIYAGTTTIDGRPAIVVTWYRMPTNDDRNSRLLSNTFQVVLIQEPTTNATTDGYDFTIQFNIGTATENDDGYSNTNPSWGCIADLVDSDAIDDCRWAMGWAKYDSATDTAAADELFSAAPINTLIDSAGSTSLVQNRLNSTVPGRYSWKMVGGNSVGFAAPTLDGTDAGTITAAVPAAEAVAAEPELAATGSQASTPVVLGLALLIVGGVVLLRARRQSHPAS